MGLLLVLSTLTPSLRGKEPSPRNPRHHRCVEECRFSLLTHARGIRLVFEIKINGRTTCFGLSPRHKILNSHKNENGKTRSHKTRQKPLFPSVCNS